MSGNTVRGPKANTENLSCQPTERFKKLSQASFFFQFSPNLQPMTFRPSLTKLLDGFLKPLFVTGLLN